MYLLLAIGMFLTYSNAFHIEKSLSFLVGTEQVFVGIDGTIESVSLIFPFNITIAKWKPSLEAVDAAFTSFKNLKIFTDINLKREFADTLNEGIKQNLEAQNIFSNIYAELSSTVSAKNETSCVFIVPSITSNQLVNPTTFLTTRMAKLVAWTPAEVTPEKIAQLNAFINTFNQICAELYDELKSVSQQWNELQQLNFPDSLLPFLEQIKCIEKSQFEKVIVDSCLLSRDGLYCELTVHILKEADIFEKLIPINYRGIALKVPNKNAAFVKGLGQEDLKILNCKTEAIQKINRYCALEKIEEECGQSLQEQNVNEILKNCPFEQDREPLSYKKMTNGGLLVLTQGEITVGSHTLFEQPPLIIYSNENVSILIDGQKLHVPNTVKVTEQKIVISSLTENQLLALEGKIYWQEFLNKLDLGDFIQWAHIVFEVLTIPLTLFGVILGCQMKRSKKVDKLARKQARRNNFKEARDLLESSM